MSSLVTGVTRRPAHLLGRAPAPALSRLGEQRTQHRLCGQPVRRTCPIGVHTRNFDAEALLRVSDRDALFLDPLSDVLGAPHGHPLGELHGFRKGASLDAAPQGRLGDGNERQHLRLTQEAGVGQLEVRRRRAGGRSRRGDGKCVVHDRALSRPGPAKVMTCSVAAALGQVGASRWGTLNSTARRARPGVAAWWFAHDGATSVVTLGNLLSPMSCDPAERLPKFETHAGRGARGRYRLRRHPKAGGGSGHVQQAPTAWNLATPYSISQVAARRPRRLPPKPPGKTVDCAWRTLPPAIPRRRRAPLLPPPTSPSAPQRPRAYRRHRLPSSFRVSAPHRRR